MWLPTGLERIEYTKKSVISIAGSKEETDSGSKTLDGKRKQIRSPRYVLMDVGS